MALVIPEYCVVKQCNEDGERAHLITRKTLPKDLWDEPSLYIYLCRKHHSEIHNSGIETFCAKYGLLYKLHLARERVARS